MSATQGDIDVIITQQALKNIDDAAAKVEGLYISFVNLVGAIENTKNLVDASNNVKSMASNTARLSIEVGKAKTVSTEFTDVIFKQDEAYRQAGDALNKLDKEQLKAIQNAGSYSKASKLLIDNVAGETKAIDNLSGAFKRLESDYKAALLYAKNVGAEFGLTSKQFTKAAFDANLLGKEVKAMNAALGNHTGNVGNYAADIEKALSKTVIPAQKVSISIGDIWGGIRKLAYILPGIGIAGLFNVAGEAAYKLFEYITDINSELTKSDAKFQAMNAALSSGEYTNAIVNVNKLTEEIKLAKEGFISKTETLKSYNDTLGKTIGHANSLDEAESLIVKHGDAYIQMMLLKAAANEALNSAAKKAMEAEKTRLEGEKQIIDGIDANGDYKAGGLQSFKLLFTQGFGSDEELLSKQIGKSVGKIKDEEKTFKDIAKQFQDDAAKIAKSNKFDYYSGKEGPKKGPKPKEVNRVDILKKEYEDEILAQKKLFVDGTLSEQEYRYKQLEIIHKYATDRIDAIDNMSTHEKDSARSLENTWLDTTKTLADANAADQKKRLAELDKQVEGFTEAQDKELKALQDRYKAEAKLRADDAADADYWFKWLEKQSDNQFDDEQRKIQKKQQLNDQYWNKWISTGRSSMELVDIISNAIYSREIDRLDRKEKVVTETYTTEIRFIEQSGMSAAWQAEAKQKLDTDTEARKKQIDRDRIKALRKQAQFNKTLTISELTLETTIAVIRALSEKGIPYYLKAINAVSAFAAGTAQIAKAAAVKLPEYAKGRSKGPKEFARTNEQGPELHVTKEGKMYIPNEGKDGITLLEQDTKVIPHDITKQLLNSAYIKLANNGEVVTTNKMTAAMLEAYENQTDEIVRLQNILIKKQFGPNGMDMSGYRNYKSMMIKQ